MSHSLFNTAYRHCCETLPDIRTYTIHGSFLDPPKLPMLVSPCEAGCGCSCHAGLLR